MRAQPKLLLCIAVFTGFTAQAQFGSLKNKLKDKAKETITQPSSPAKENNASPAAGQPAKEPAIISASAGSANGSKDANGFLINDPEANALFQGKDVYGSTDIYLFSLLLNTSASFKMAGVAVSKTAETLELMPVAKRISQSPLKATVSMKLNAAGYYEYQTNYSGNIYAQVQGDGSVLLFNAQHAELVSKDEAQLKAATEESLMSKAAAALSVMKVKKNSAKKEKEIQENETYYKSGNVAASKKDAALESKILSVLNGLNNGAGVEEKDKADYTKILLISTDWNVEKNEFGVPLKMTCRAWAIGRYTMSKECFFQKVYMKKDYLGGGTYGDVKFDEGQRPSIVSCAILQ